MKRISGYFAAALMLPILFCGCSGTLDLPGSEGKTVAVENRQSISFRKIPADGVYSGSTVVGDQFELSLGEDPDNGVQWSVTDYTLPQCLVRLEHKRDGFRPFLFSRAEVGILLKKRGISSVTLQCPGKTVTILVNAQ